MWELAEALADLQNASSQASRGRWVLARKIDQNDVQFRQRTPGITKLHS
jgi:hypothetical protein